MSKIALVLFILSVTVSYSKSVYCDTVFYFKTNIYNNISKFNNSISTYKLHFATNDTLFVLNSYGYEFNYISKDEYLKVDSIFNLNYYKNKNYDLKEIYNYVSKCNFDNSISLNLLLRSYWLYMYNSAKNDSTYLSDSIISIIYNNKPFWNEFDYQKSIKFYVGSLIKYYRISQSNSEIIHKMVKYKLNTNLDGIELEIAHGYLYEMLLDELNENQRANLLNDVIKIKTKLIREYIFKLYSPINYDKSLEYLNKYIKTLNTNIYLYPKIIIYFWGDWCYYSKEEFKNIENIDHVILFNLTNKVNDSIKTTLIQKLTIKEKSNYDILDMYESDLSKNFNVYSLPQWIVIDNQKRKVTNYGTSLPKILD